MGAAEMIDMLESLGVSVQSEGSKLLLEPGSLVPPELIPQIRLYKLEMLELLASQVNTGEGTVSLLAWASELAEQGVVLTEPVTFIEAPLRTIRTVRVSHHASIHLRTITLAKTNQITGGWGRFTREWWREQEQTALRALAALRAAMEEQCSGEGQS